MFIFNLPLAWRKILLCEAEANVAHIFHKNLYIYICPAVPFCKYCSYTPVGIEFYERFATGICVGTFLRNSIGSYNASV